MYIVRSFVRSVLRHDVRRYLVQTVHMCVLQEKTLGRRVGGKGAVRWKVLNKRLNALNGTERERSSYLSLVSPLLLIYVTGAASQREAKPERTIILSIYLSSSAFKRRGNNDAARETFGNLLRGARKRETARRVGGREGVKRGRRRDKQRKE